MGLSVINTQATPRGNSVIKLSKSKIGEFFFKIFVFLRVSDHFLSIGNEKNLKKISENFIFFFSNIFRRSIWIGFPSTDFRKYHWKFLFIEPFY